MWCSRSDAKAALLFAARLTWQLYLPLDHRCVLCSTPADYRRVICKVLAGWLGGRERNLLGASPGRAGADRRLHGRTRVSRPAVHQSLLH